MRSSDSSLFHNLRDHEQTIRSSCALRRASSLLRDGRISSGRVTFTSGKRDGRFDVADIGLLLIFRCSENVAHLRGIWLLEFNEAREMARDVLGYIEK